jgi:predicted Fe-Mo cluster-binding NifX family protein
VYDTETDGFEAVDNKMNLNAAQGAGIQTAQNVAATGAGAVIGANFGPKAVQVLQAAGIKMFLCSAGTVKEALEDYKAGKLAEASGANVRSHW